MKVNAKKLLVVNRFEILEGHLTEAEQLWANSLARKILKNLVIYKGLTDNRCVLLYEVEDLFELQLKLASDEYQQTVQSLSSLMASDFRQEIVGLVEEVCPRDTLVPITPFMQLRHIEVPLSGIEPYLEWRQRRIFDYVKRNDKVHSFLAFHSVFSTTPGVLFVVEFTDNPVEYRNSFLTSEYQAIIEEAGHAHIKGGLNTVEYQLAVKPLLLEMESV